MPTREVRLLAGTGLGCLAAAAAIGLVLGPPTAVVTLIAAGVALAAGRAAHAAGIADRVDELAAATRAVVDSSQNAIESSQHFGPLAPVADGVATLVTSLESAVEAATTDRLTHVANRPMLLATLFEEVERAGRYGRPLTIGFIDIDHFKAVNDTYGHEAGDAVLQRVGALLNAQIRASDVVGRYGGEEFVVIFPETGVDEATGAAEKLRMAIAKLRIEIASGEELAVTASIGLAGGHGQPLRVDDLLRDADAAMYAAKSLGRDQTYVFAEVDDDSARIPRAPISAEARVAASEVGEQGRRAAESALAAVIMPLPHYRGKPSSLIASICEALARRLELPEAEVERIRVAALLHDIGKVGVPDEILDKPRPLSSEEWQSVVQHPRIGQEIINRVAAIKDASAIILHHHERFSGHGYPHGVRGADIPLGARIVAIADAYEAMLSDRPYRSAIGHEAAIAELRDQAGRQFDPELVELFCTLYADQPPLGDAAADDEAMMMERATHALLERSDGGHLARRASG